MAGRKRKVGRPKSKRTKKTKVTGCQKVAVYRKHKGRVQKIKGVRRKTCLTKRK